MQSIVILSLPFIFLLSLIIGLSLYWLGGRIGAKAEKSLEKVAPYACGEDLPPREIQFNVEQFLIYAVYFLIFDILAFIIATSLNTIGFIPAIYTFIVLMTIVVLLPTTRRR